MKRLRQAIKCRRGLTLMELMITLSLLVILMGVVMTMLFTGTNTYVEQANYGISKQIGDSCLKWLEKRLTDADHVRVDAGVGALAPLEEAHYLTKDGVTHSGAGRLYSKPHGEAAFDVFGETFYFGKWVTVEMAPVGEDSVKLRVAVVEEDASGAYTPVYANELTVRLLNLKAINGEWTQYDAAALISSRPENPAADE